MRGLGILLAATIGTVSANAEEWITHQKESAELNGAYASGDHLPYLMTQNQGGILSPQGSQGYVRAAYNWSARRGKLCLEAGIDAVGYFSSHYDYYSRNGYLQQLYAEASWGKYFITLGSKAEQPKLVDARLSSGNWLWSGNARPMPGVRIGTNDFVPMAILGGNIEGSFDISWQRMNDGSWQDARFDAYVNHAKEVGYVKTVNALHGGWLHRKSVFFRTASKFPFFVTIGLEHGAIYAGDIRHYDDTRYDGADPDKNPALFQHENSWLGSAFGAKGKDYPNKETNITESNKSNQMFAFDIRLDLRLRRSSFALYKQTYYDDLKGSTSALTDGLWGIEVKQSRFRWINHLVAEYVQATKQGIGKQSINYYMDERFGAYTHYGMAVGSSMLVSPIYNADNYLGFAFNNMRGWQVAFEGELTRNTTYLVKVGGKKTYGSPYYALGDRSYYGAYDGQLKDWTRTDVAEKESSLSNTSMLLQVTYRWGKWNFMPTIAFDRGDLYGNNFGAMFSARIAVE